MSSFQKEKEGKTDMVRVLQSSMFAQAVASDRVVIVSSLTCVCGRRRVVDRLEMGETSTMRSSDGTFASEPERNTYAPLYSPGEWIQIIARSCGHGPCAVVKESPADSSD